MISKIKRMLAINKAVTFTFIGDSVTWGLNHCTTEETYVAFFAKKMAQAFPNVKVIRYDGFVKDEQSPILRYDPIVVQEGTEGTIHVIRSGVGGNTVTRAMTRMQDFTGTLCSGTQSDYIFLMFGINDALLADPAKYVPAEVFKENYREFLHLLKEDAPNAKLIVMTATTNDQSIDAHVQATYELVKEEEVEMIDLNALWNSQYDATKANFGYGDWLATDACHPTPKSAEIMAQTIFDNLMSR